MHISYGKIFFLKSMPKRNKILHWIKGFSDTNVGNGGILWFVCSGDSSEMYTIIIHISCKYLAHIKEWFKDRKNKLK